MQESPMGPLTHPRKPELVLPENSCDSHCHVFGPGSKFPFRQDDTTPPPDAPIEQLERLWDLLGFRRAVIVHSMVHGYDHSALINALRRGDGRYRGVAVIRPDTPDSEIAMLHSIGVRGARFHFMPHLGNASPEDVSTVVDKVRAYDWHIALHVSGNTIANLEDFIRTIPLRVVIDHMARVDLRDGFNSPGITAVMRLLEVGHVWIKLSGTDRLALNPPSMTDSLQLARSLMMDAPERVLWGTDHPHPNTSGFMPDEGDLVDNIAVIAPSEQERRLLLVDNPTECFDFEK